MYATPVLTITRQDRRLARLAHFSLQRFPTTRLERQVGAILGVDAGGPLGRRLVARALARI